MLEISTHKNIILQILKDIYADTAIAPFLGFKGGTPAYLFYDLPRFSVDLDFDLIDQSKEELVFSHVSDIIKPYGRVKEATKKRFTLFFLMAYNVEGQNIKIEISRRPSPSKYHLKTYFGVSMLVIEREDMFANKLMAMAERLGRANRDIFDVWFFLKNNWPINQKMIEERTGLAFDKFLSQCAASLKKMDFRNILAGMGELLDNRQKQWIKANLKNEVIFLLKVRMENS